MIQEITFLDIGSSLHEIGLSALLSNLHEIVIAFPIIFLILGLAYCFYGREIFDIANFLVGGLIAIGFAVSLSGSMNIGMIFVSIIAFLIGGLIGFFVPYLLVGIVGFTVGLGLFIAFSPMIGLISGIIVAVGAVLLFRFFLPLLTALLGGSLTAYAVFEWTGSEPISIVVGIVLILTGTIYQYRYLEPHRREKEGERV